MSNFLYTNKGVAIAILSLLGINDVVGMNALRSRKLQQCDILKTCYLVNIQTREEFKLSGSNEYKLDPGNSKGYSIRCDVKGIDGAELNFMKFFYNNVVHDEFDTNRYMNGDSYNGGWVNPVPYLQTCGRKHVVVEGHIWTNLCFREKFNVNMVDADGSCNPPNPIQPPNRPPSRPPTPVSSPVNPPFKAPVNPTVRSPTKAPVKPPRKPPTKSPTKAPVKPPRRPQTSAPVLTPVQQPTQIKTPVKSPTYNQTTNDV